jgi:diguanylate cyclase (GGDEF)-like protein
LLVLSYLFLYRGILLFCDVQNNQLNDLHSRRTDRRWASAKTNLPAADPRFNRAVYEGFLPLLSMVSAIAFCAIAYFTYVRPRLDAQIIIAAAVLALARALMALALLRNAAGRTPMKLFGYSLAAFSAISVYHLLATLIHGAPAGLLRSNATQTLTLIGSLVFIGLNGMFYVTMINQSVTELIEEKALLDFVTATLNRRGIEEALGIEIERANRTGIPVSILLIDVDHFKAVNDSFGHPAGDQALRSIARCIAGTIRAYDKLGRFGGDEFLVLLPETFGDQAMFLAARLREALRRLNLPVGAPELTLSIGVTHSRADENSDDIFKRADNALYLAKQAGRDCARLQSPPAIQPRRPSREPKEPTPV